MPSMHLSCKIAALFILGAGLFCNHSSAEAKPIPAEALNAQYNACMSKIAQTPDAFSNDAKKKYCGCIRDSIQKKWDMDKVETLSKQNNSQGFFTNELAQEMNEIGQDCLQQAMK